MHKMAGFFRPFLFMSDATEKYGLHSAAEGLLLFLSPKIVAQYNVKIVQNVKFPDILKKCSRHSQKIIDLKSSVYCATFASTKNDSKTKK